MDEKQVPVFNYHTLPMAPRTTVASEQPLRMTYLNGANM